MDASFSLFGLTTPLQILLVDLLLGADNALLIGLACRALPAEERKRATAIGVGGAIVLRLLMTMVATTLLALPLIKLIGAIILMVIALNLANHENADLETLESSNGDRSRLWTVAAIIVVADAAMSLDNVVAIAAIARGNYLWLLIGVALSLPMLGYGGLLIAQWLRRAPNLITFGAATLGWIAGSMAVSDLLWSKWAETDAPAVAALAPIFGAAFVYLHGLVVPQPVAAPQMTTRPRAPPVARPVSAVARLPEDPPASKPAPIREIDSTAPGTDQSDGARRFEDRVMLFGVLLLAIVAGGFLLFVSLHGGLE